MKKMHLIWQLMMVTVVTISVSCSPESVSKEELRTYCDDPKNGLYQELTTDNITSSMKYIPSELLFDSSNSKIDLMYWRLGLSYKGGELLQTQKGMETYYPLLHRLTFEMSKHVKMSVDGGDEIYPIASSYLSSHGFGGADEVLLVFEKQLGDTYNLTMTGLEMGLPMSKFEFRSEDIEKIPVLTTL